MKKLIVILIILTLFIGYFNIRSIDVLNALLSSDHYEIESNISYGTDPRQTLDVYYPTKDVNQTQGKDKPVIVFIYGGAWKMGDKKDYTFIAHAFTQAGYRVVIPNYRLYPAVKFPLFIDDIADAIAYLEQQKIHLLGDLSKGIVLMGHSAGAHTAALLATDQHYLKSRKIKTPLIGLVALSGPYDLELDHPEVIPIFLPIEDTNSIRPARMVHNNMPPVLLLHGKKDIRVDPLHTDVFAEKLQQQGVQLTLKRYENVNHADIVGSIALPLRYKNPSYQDIITFLGSLKQ